MAYHDLLPGCRVPWRHDECPAFVSSPPDGPFFGGAVCHCPCHVLTSRIARLEAALITLGVDPDRCDHEVGYCSTPPSCVDDWV